MNLKQQKILMAANVPFRFSDFDEDIRNLFMRMLTTNEFTYMKDEFGYIKNVNSYLIRRYRILAIFQIIRLMKT